MALKRMTHHPACQGATCHPDCIIAKDGEKQLPEFIFKEETVKEINELQNANFEIIDALKEGVSLNLIPMVYIMEKELTDDLEKWYNKNRKELEVLLNGQILCLHTRGYCWLYFS